MLDSATDTQVSGVVASSTPVKRRRLINPKLLLPIVNLTETLIVISTGIAAFVSVGASSKLSLFIAMLIGFSAFLLKLLLDGNNHISTEEFVKLSFLRRLSAPLFPVLSVMIISYILLTIVEPDTNGLMGGLGIKEFLWLWSLVFLAVSVTYSAVITFILRRCRARGILVQTVAIVGAGEHAEHLIKWLNLTHPDLIEIVGIFDDRGGNRAAVLPLGHLIRGTIDDLIYLSEQTHLDRVLVALPHAAQDRLLHILRTLRRLPADITLAPELIAFSALDEHSRKTTALPLFDVYARPLQVGEQLRKALFDKAIAGLLVFLLLPVLLIISLAIYLESGRPILFHQRRYGLGHRVITVFKFRTMYAELSDHNCLQQTEVCDPRTTKVGRWLRRLSFDELPQLFNVLRGEMSLVGPRPLAIEMRVEDRLNQDLVSEYCFRHRVKPGITGWAQIHGFRGAVYSREALQQRVACDLFYIDNWSLWFDIKIILSTIKEVFVSRNAY